MMQTFPETAPRVIVIPPKPELARSKAVQRQLRVAAYCRVSTDDEEQLTSYEAQQTYYTDKTCTATSGVRTASPGSSPSRRRWCVRCTTTSWRDIASA